MQGWGGVAGSKRQLLESAMQRGRQHREGEVRGDQYLCDRPLLHSERFLTVLGLGTLIFIAELPL